MPPKRKEERQEKISFQLPEEKGILVKTFLNIQGRYVRIKKQNGIAFEKQKFENTVAEGLYETMDVGIFFCLDDFAFFFRV